MIVANQLMSRIIHHLAVLKQTVAFSGLLQRTDLHKTAENFFAGFLTRFYGVTFVNLNHEQDNFPAIDLGQTEMGLGIQITAESDKRKIQKTLNTALRHRLYDRFPHLQVLIIGDKQGKYGDLTVDDRFTFDAADDVFDLRDLIKQLDRLETPRLQELADYLDQEMIGVVKASDSVTVEKKEKEFLAQQERRASAEYQKFERAVSGDKYRNFRAKRGIVMLMVNPVNEPGAIRVVTDQHTPSRLAPLFWEYGNLRTEPDSLLCTINRYDDKPPTAIAEICKGKIKAVVMRISESYQDGDRNVALDGFWLENEISKYAWTYIQFLQSHGVKGPWFVGFSLLKMHNTSMPFDPIFAGDNRNKVSDISGGLTLIPDETSSADGLADLLKTGAFYKMWRAYLPGRPIKNEQGFIAGYDPGPC